MRLIERTFHPDWQLIIAKAWNKLEESYVQDLENSLDWYPGFEKLLAAFNMPLNNIRYILLGESPYPRLESANGYAFWDNNVGDLWCETGLSKSVNRATSLRNWIKMMLVARGDLNVLEVSQSDIARLDKQVLVQTAEQLFKGMIDRGILLLNACLVYSPNKVSFHARKWKPFMEILLKELAAVKPDVELILLGKIAESIPQNHLNVGLVAEHPYNITFISNQKVLDFFRPLDLLKL